MDKEQASSGKTKKSARTQARIIHSYLDLMREKYFEKISVKELVIKASITRGTFYLYFNDIYELQQHIENTLLEDFSKYCLEDRELFAMPHGKLSDWGFALEAPPALIRWFDYCELHRNELNVLLGSNGDPYFIVKLKKELEKFINRLMDSDHMPHDKMREYFVVTFVELNLLFARQLLNEASRTGTANEAGEAEVTLSKGRLAFILNTLRVGANCLAHFDVEV